MILYFYQAECGDAARIHYLGVDGNLHNIFIDAGFERTYTHVLAEQIELLRKAGESIDLWVVSHIHDDHIGGVIAYKNAIEIGQASDIVKDWYYNPPRSPISSIRRLISLSPSSAKSISQGDGLAEYIANIGRLPHSDITTALPLQNIYGLKIKILSPSPAKLNQLRKNYSPITYKNFEPDELSEISTAKATRFYDYHIPIESFDLKSWKEDESIENGSSIAILTEFETKKILWLADSHPSIIVSSLKDMGYSKSNPLVCDWVKVTHHGSKANNSNELYELICCSNYLMSVNGENKHYLPNKECIALILRNPGRSLNSTYRFYFTYDNEILRSIFKVDGKQVFEKWNFTVEFLSNSKWVCVQ